MKAITLWRPWPHVIRLGLKTIETRGHSAFRVLKGQRVALHAGKRFDSGAGDQVYRALGGRLPVCLGRTTYAAMQRLRDPAAWPEGIICTAFVREARWLTSADAPGALYDCAGRFGLILDDICPLDPPQQCRGAQGIWEWDPAAPLRPQLAVALMVAGLFGGLE